MRKILICEHKILQYCDGKSRKHNKLQLFSLLHISHSTVTKGVADKF